MPPGLIAAVALVAFLVVLAVFGVLAWRAGGPQPLKEQTVAIAVPGQGK